MHPRSSSAIFLFSVFAGAAAASGDPAAGGALCVMPAPVEVRQEAGRISVSGSLAVSGVGASDARLEGAVARAKALWRSRLGAVDSQQQTLEIRCAAPAPEIPVLAEDESYSLDLSPARWGLRAPNTLGILHGLETLLQLLQRDGSGWYLPVISINDRPRFPWRGLMIDVARRWQPVDVIERNLDAMAAVKLNVLHLHLTDDQGFRIESRTHPELQGKGSDGRYFTQEQMRGIITYASMRGIRVVPEFDVPGHATSWVVSHPELASLPGPYGVERQWGVFNPVLDPTNEATYALLSDFLGEMAALFPDAYVHIGGDENNGVQWNANPRIQAFIAANALTDNAGLHAYFNKRIAAILSRNGKKVVGWDEILHPGLPAGVVIDSWRGTQALADAAAQGYDGMLSNGFYIDLMHSAAEHYAADPIPASSTLTPQQRAHILGGEATMWAEWVTPETIDSRIWPRTAAIAERLWSPQGAADVADMYRRLAAVSDRLDEAGALHKRNADLMLRHLVGVNLDAPGVAQLRTFISLIEPVKVYARGGLQVWCNQCIPLIGLADAAQPESDASREFASAVDRMLFGPAGIDRAAAGALGAELRDWAGAATVVSDTLPGDYPAVRDAIPTARDLSAACAVGQRALAALASGTPASRETMAADLALLDTAALPNPSATLLPIVAPVRLLAAAAAVQADTPAASGDAWRARVMAATAPAPAPR